MNYRESEEKLSDYQYLKNRMIKHDRGNLKIHLVFSAPKNISIPEPNSTKNIQGNFENLQDFEIYIKARNDERDYTMTLEQALRNLIPL